MSNVPTVSKIMIIRHAEKPDGVSRGVDPNGSPDDEALTVRGWQRSGGLVALFDPARGPLQTAALARPGRIFASQSSPTKHSQRPFQTVAALAQRLGISPVTFDHTKIPDLVDAVLAATGAVLISWQHEDIPAIARAIADKSKLPVTPVSPSPWPPPEWPGQRFDLVWVLELVGNDPPTSWSFTQVPQLLLPGDSAEVIAGSAS
ncbi:MAG TPA: hypothetical protein VGH33_10870 [Isosphaeraceae bacterium]|jgi:hypothetical protein